MPPDSLFGAAENRRNIRLDQLHARRALGDNRRHVLGEGKENAAAEHHGKFLAGVLVCRPGQLGQCLRAALENIAGDFVAHFACLKNAAGKGRNVRATAGVNIRNGILRRLAHLTGDQIVQYGCFTAFFLILERSENGLLAQPEAAAVGVDQIPQTADVVQFALRAQKQAAARAHTMQPPSC